MPRFIRSTDSRGRRHTTRDLNNHDFTVTLDHLLTHENEIVKVEVFVQETTYSRTPKWTETPATTTN